MSMQAYFAITDINTSTVSYLASSLERYNIGLLLGSVDLVGKMNRKTNFQNGIVGYNTLNRTGWYRGDVLNSYWRRAWFESRSEHWIFSSSYCQVSSVPSGKLRQRISIKPCRILPYPFQFFIHLALYHCRLYKLTFRGKR
jgi:hypothetical protein